jgi:glycerate-2-kinase
MAMICNRDSLLVHGQRQMRRAALDIIEAGLAVADPGRGTYRQVRLAGERLQVADRTIDLATVRHIYFVGVGKGSYPIAEALEAILGSRIAQGVLIVKSGERRRLSRIEVIEAGHPIPNEASVRGARRLLEVADLAGPDDLVFAGVTGGSSALATLPPPGVTLADVQDLTDCLLKSGATIRDMNAVRKHVCLIKGGRLIAAIQPALGITLTLDTAPEGLPWPDLCLPDPTTFADAIAVLKHFDIWQAVSPAIRKHLEEGQHHPERETVKSVTDMRTMIVSVGDPVSTCEAAADSARRLGYTPFILGTAMEGEAVEVGACLAGIAKEIWKFNRPFPAPCALISGGETTVTIRGNCGRGGPNQELVLGFASKAPIGVGLCCVSIGTDGTDGPTDFAGGIVDGTSMERAAARSLNLADYARRHDSATVLTLLHDAIITGHTGTNVLDLRVVLVGPHTQEGSHA